MLRIGNYTVRVERDRKHRLGPREYKARQLYVITSKPSKGPPMQIADLFLSKAAPLLGVSRADLKYDKVQHSLLGSHVLYQQFHEDRPVTGAWIKVDINKGRVYHASNTCIPSVVAVKPASRTPARAATKPALLGEQKAGTIAKNKVGAAGAEVLKPELVSYPHEGELKPAWKVVVKKLHPLQKWRVYVDASNGRVLDYFDQIRRLNGVGLVFDPNPVAALNDTALTGNATIPDCAYRPVTLLGLKRNGHLDGLYVSTSETPRRVKRTNRRFLFHRDGTRTSFSEVMAYFHVDRVQRYIQELGIHNVMDHPIAVQVTTDPGEEETSFDPDEGKLHLVCDPDKGADADDAEIIVHEYGHAIRHVQVPFPHSERAEAEAMEEGFADYLAASFFADLKPEKLKPCVGSWYAIATGANGADPPCLRRVDSNKTYPKDQAEKEYIDCEIWSACLWELRSQLGRPIADLLAIAHHPLLQRTGTFEDAANAILMVDQQKNQGHNEAVIRDVFVRRGILPNRKRRNRRAGVR